ncbi:hypothetical protein M1B72_10550 [Geomonas paludis]|uniref:Uncharacterized protein n=1 Tax=Geomonas paludis TaxID=2740185 RepID=A0A6V8MT73_9BACT|nr:hypothetical protein [Geomonas paludis]UPU38122.1 hypothetical protein M1B72_10550 [Geomonas paludis]GFO63348.1 hypothetical protein GMPD_12670 [Geomonas paludis]
MQLTVLASDLKYKYPKVTQTRFDAKFSGPGDDAPFNRDDLYDILPMLTAVMNDLERDDAGTLHFLEDLMNQDMPRFLVSRGEVFDFLTGCGREMLSYR